ncbi:nickel pincer cofactor biosynthesis protein LarB [Candidatus Synechococcus calcipolaris G9]|uniref:Nickel pincer cofactor biosynthesis protein LarB n=1 Tax=Candidatus Synechococcus calcipolaris G9 TaxID=1497997 RepID=A0ABT6F2U4_9SYNE|nr:nickel pincer cofactor biosynthesis protein LarB [Candidatus Synechococcus calcipolaris]MDG2992135.1 nickel pincer cofactor biosynthesis protein LarB [Candidatus Synechococcus calcipolaris G9]
MISNSQALLQLLESVAGGDISVDLALEKLKHFGYEPVGDFARIDHHRTLRTGFPEVIWGPGKTAEQIAEIIQRMQPHHDCVMATRISPEVFGQLRSPLPNLYYFPQARICSTCDLPETPTQVGQIGLLAAGTADLPIAEEAAITAQLSGFAVKRFFDVGVAGIHRLLSIQTDLAEMAVLIVVAGMEGALPSVVAGLVEAPVIAVPTSIGYGANLGGLAALLTMLNSCAPGIGVVNIDNGFGAAMLAAKMVRSQQKIIGND